MVNEYPTCPFAIYRAGQPRESIARLNIRLASTLMATLRPAFSLLKRGIIGSWHKVSAKHLPAYPEEMTFRFNRRNSHTLFLDTLRHMITTDPSSYETLTA